MVKEILGLLVMLSISVFWLAIAVSMMLSSFCGAPFVPTGGRKVRRMLELAKLKKGEKLYELGAGDGRFVIAAAQHGVEAVGVEINPFQVWWCNVRIALKGLSDKAKVVRGNIFDQNLRSADVITCYLLPETNKRLQPKLLRELKPGTRIVSHAFRFHGWEPIEIDTKEHLYMYKIGALKKKKNGKSA